MAKIIKRMIVCLVLSVVVLVGGCQTMVNDKQQEIRRYSRISELNRRMMNEDLDAIFLLDRPSSLTPWHVPLE